LTHLLEQVDQDASPTDHKHGHEPIFMTQFPSGTSYLYCMLYCESISKHIPSILRKASSHSNGSGCIRLTSVELFGCPGEDGSILVDNLPIDLEDAAGIYLDEKQGVLICGGFSCRQGNFCGLTNRCFSYSGVDVWQELLRPCKARTGAPCWPRATTSMTSTAA